MVLMPACWALVRQALPVSESRLTISSTCTPSLIMLSQIVPNLALSPLAFWMFELMPAVSNALLRNGRSLDSQRGEVVASGRITPTLPLAAAPPPRPPLVLLLLPHAATTSVPSAARASSATVFLRMCQSFRGGSSAVPGRIGGWPVRRSEAEDQVDHQLVQPVVA